MELAQPGIATPEDQPQATAVSEGGVPTGLA
jgi:hypothetical protein